MSENYEIFSLEKHKEYFVQISGEYSYASHLHMVSIVPSEIAKVALNFPISFIKSKNDSYHMVAILGLQAGSNVFINDGHFDTVYVPQNIAKYPFALAKNTHDDVVMAVNPDVLNTQGIGTALVTSEGQPSEYTISKQKQLLDLAEQELLSSQFIEKLNELGLLTEQSFKFDLGDGEKKQISGLFSVDRDLLNTISDEDMLLMQKNGMLEAIYSQLISLGQFQRLIDKSTKS
ncbi:MAG: SapC family protein [Pseudoalteromonas sp.]|uniref:SapC family protein n=1 Tax=unclassified Pseudoalteromonas TaxID=194690 RepID=UPI000C06EBA2|nr:MULTISPECIES: SapC family protein [unclassified Pseudoalteromonas]MDP2635369.1 SapC family protein [Pseudoalteromonas sp. 1_MG-2023]PHN89803.1 SapC protein [Pseudoalteromonas sp. 3D05]